MYSSYNENKNGFSLYKSWKENISHLIIFICHHIVGIVPHKMVSLYLQKKKDQIVTKSFWIEKELYMYLSLKCYFSHQRDIKHNLDWLQTFVTVLTFWASVNPSAFRHFSALYFMFSLSSSDIGTRVVPYLWPLHSTFVIIIQLSIFTITTNKFIVNNCFLKHQVFKNSKQIPSQPLTSTSSNRLLKHVTKVNSVSSFTKFRNIPSISYMKYPF